MVRRIDPRALRPVPVEPAAAVVREGTGLPLVLRPAGDDVDLVEWAGAEREALEAELLRHGGLLLRGFGVTEPAELERFAGLFVDELFADNGEHPRAQMGGGVYTPVFFPPEERLLWHNENSFNRQAPAKIWFCCARPAASGGETPLVDSRAVYDRLDAGLRDEFAAKGVCYVRNYGTGIGLDWPDVFRTGDRAQVEARCAAEGLRWQWRGDRLRTEAVRPAVVRHPGSGARSWFNQAQHWHLACLNERTRASLLATFPADELPRTCTFGDGSPIPDAAMAEILRVYQELEVVFPWQAGDVVMLDNFAVAHGRNPFTGPRSLLVAMGDMRTVD
ncbi:TauD/TfdA family dioxygenase [Dactylosporangium salmoneum]|uniref:TauD/TfdA family dioxygenase n=1 Tax=Dactylosporangium salmoneum TaxID=53361 RepID=A0ABP5TRV8_9ACTN